jgi:gamma-glutamylcysteine synthetase
MLATTPHPPARLGADAPFVTTDFSESQVELITGVPPAHNRASTS